MPKLNRTKCFLIPELITVDTTKTPDNWLDQLCLILEQHQQKNQVSFPDEYKEFRSNINKIIGQQSTFAKKELLKDGLTYCYLTYITPDTAVGLKDCILSRLPEGILNCAPGYMDRVRVLRQELETPDSLIGTIYNYRKAIITSLANTYKQEVHTYNRYFNVAAKLDYGIKPINLDDPHTGTKSDDEITKDLLEAFDSKYTFVATLTNCYDLLTAKISEIMQQQGAINYNKYTNRNELSADSISKIYNLVSTHYPHKNITNNEQSKIEVSDIFKDDYSDINPEAIKLNLFDALIYLNYFEFDEKELLIIGLIKDIIQSNVEINIEDLPKEFFSFFKNINEIIAFIEFTTNFTVAQKYIMINKMFDNKHEDNVFICSIIANLQEELSSKLIEKHRDIILAGIFSEDNFYKIFNTLKDYAEQLLTKAINKKLWFWLKDWANHILILAAENGYKSIAEQLFKITCELDISINIDFINTAGFTALYWASYKNHADIVKILIDRGANISHKLAKGEFKDITPLYTACYRGNIQIVEILLNTSDSPQELLINSICNGTTPLTIASAKGHHKIVEALLNHDKNIDYINTSPYHRGETALYVAAKYDRAEVVKKLINAGGNKDFHVKEGFTPICIAAKFGNITAVDALINAGVDINLPVKSYTHKKVYPLVLAVENNHINTTVALLNAGANTNKLYTEERYKSPVYNSYSLHLAIKNGSNTIVKVLLDAGADPNSYTEEYPYKKTPLWFAITFERADIVKLLIENGADSIGDLYLKTPGHLIDNCKDIKYTDRVKVSPLYVAVEKDNIKIVEILLTAGTRTMPNVVKSIASAKCMKLFIDSEKIRNFAKEIITNRIKKLPIENRCGISDCAIAREAHDLFVILFTNKELVLELLKTSKKIAEFKILLQKTKGLFESEVTQVIDGYKAANDFDVHAPESPILHLAPRVDANVQGEADGRPVVRHGNG